LLAASAARIGQGVLGRPATLDDHILTIKSTRHIPSRMRHPRTPEANTDVIQGTLDLLIPKTLSLELFDAEA